MESGVKGSDVSAKAGMLAKSKIAKIKSLLVIFSSFQKVDQIPC